ncbi:Helicase associated domain protein [Streptomyces sp. NPDC017086]|uniref:helicase associated domain-containing protein n=1 Tax=Streptomyces sp. NPDC017086 TaxID=3364976 RepID=UPI003799F248
MADLRRSGGVAHVLLEDTGGDDGRLLRLEARSEFLAVVEDGACRALVPHVISLVDNRTSWVLPVEEVWRADGNAGHGPGGRAWTVSGAAPDAGGATVRTAQPGQQRRTEARGGGAGDRAASCSSEQHFSGPGGRRHEPDRPRAAPRDDRDSGPGNSGAVGDDRNGHGDGRKVARGPGTGQRMSDTASGAGQARHEVHATADRAARGAGRAQRNGPAGGVDHQFPQQSRDVVIDTERQDWARGWAKLKEFTEREGHARVPYEHKEGAFPLGTWVAEQRRAYGAGQMNGRRAARLEKLGMAWTAADARFQENLAAARVYYAEHWTLCAPRSAAALDKPIGQWLSNLRRPGALAEHPEREAALKEIDEDWNPSWPTEWQRHYAALHELVRDEEGPAEVLPGFTVHRMDQQQEPPDQADRRQARHARRPRAGVGGHGRSSVMSTPEEERRVQEAVRRHARTRAFAEAEAVISAVLSDPGVQEARARVEAEETELGIELCARLQPFQDRYDHAVAEGDAARLTATCPGKHGRWGRICVLPDGHETSMEEPHWGRNSEGRAIAWVGSAPDDW